MNRNRFLIACIIAVFIAVGCHQNSKPVIEWKPSDGYVPDSVTAVKIAEAVWLNVYGDDIADNKPFKARLKDGKIWMVEGTFNSAGFGGVPYIEIQKNDGRILKVTHGK